MTTGFLSIGAAAELMDDQFSGFDYPNNASVVALLGNGTTTRNAVLQQGALALRQGTVSAVVTSDTAATLRGYFESRETVTFTDYDGSTSDVCVLDFTRSLQSAGVGLWACTVVLLELADPIAPGA